MTDVDEGVSLEIDEPRARNPLKRWGLIIGGVLFLLGAGGATWYFFLGGRAHFAAAEPKPIETPLPSFLDLKAIVVSVASANGASHFVQLGISLQLPSSSAGDMVTAVLPQVQDTIRTTVLTFKVEDLETPDGVDKVRQAIISRLNEQLAKTLGPERIAKAAGGKPDTPIIQNLFFATLIVE